MNDLLQTTSIIVSDESTPLYFNKQASSKFNEMNLLINTSTDRSDNSSASQSMFTPITPTACSQSLSLDFSHSSMLFNIENSNSYLNYRQHRHQNSGISNNKNRKKRAENRNKCGPGYEFAKEFFKKAKVRKIMRNHTIIGTLEAKEMISFFRGVNIRSIDDADLALRYLQGKTVRSLKRILSETNELIHRLFYYGTDTNADLFKIQRLTIAVANIDKPSIMDNSPSTAMTNRHNTSLLSASLDFSNDSATLQLRSLSQSSMLTPTQMTYTESPTTFTSPGDAVQHSNLSSYDYSVDHTPSSTSFQPLAGIPIHSNFHKNFAQNFSSKKKQRFLDSKSNQNTNIAEDIGMDSGVNIATKNNTNANMEVITDYSYLNTSFISHRNGDSANQRSVNFDNEQKTSQATPIPTPPMSKKTRWREYQANKSAQQDIFINGRVSVHRALNAHSMQCSRNSVWSENANHGNPFGIDFFDIEEDNVSCDFDFESSFVLDAEESLESSNGGYLLALDAFRSSFHTPPESEEEGDDALCQPLTQMNDNYLSPVCTELRASLSMASTVTLGSTMSSDHRLIADSHSTANSTPNLTKIYPNQFGFHQTLIETMEVNLKSVDSNEDKSIYPSNFITRRRKSKKANIEKFTIDKNLMSITKQMHGFYEDGESMNSLIGSEVSPVIYRMCSEQSLRSHESFLSDTDDVRGNINQPSAKQILFRHLMEERKPPENRKTYAYSHH